MWLSKVFGTNKPVLGMVHVGALPGSPLYDEKKGLAGLIERAEADYHALVGGGVDGVIICNEHDKPHTLKAGPEIVAAITRITCEITRAKKVPFGIDILWDPIASLAIANSTGAAFIRGVVSGAYSGDLGIWNTCAGKTLRFRRNIGAGHIKILSNIVPEFSSQISPRDIGQVAKTTAYSSLADAICVSGYMAGTATPLEVLTRSKELLPDTPVFANTGVRPENVAEILSIADGCIVATSFKEGEKPGNPISVANVKKLMAIVKQVREGVDSCG